MQKINKSFVSLSLILILFQAVSPASSQRWVEHLDRGLLALRLNTTDVYIGWRMTATDPADISFNLYRSPDGITLTKLNEEPIDSCTNWIDTPPDFKKSWTYIVKPVRDGRIFPTSGRVIIEPNPPLIPAGLDEAFISIPVQSGIETVDRIGVGDLDGDGTYDYLVKHPKGVADNGPQEIPSPTTYKLDAYSSSGEFLWRQDLGWNIQLGIWYSPMLVFDLDGDGRTEVMTKTAPMEPDYRAANGRVLTGTEYFSIFDGTTGEVVAKGDWIKRGAVSDWGDYYGNRVNRNQMGIAYLDGERPSLIIFRGTYGLMKAEAWNYRDKQLTKVWAWDNIGLGPEYQSMGFHNIHIADIDNDGKDEILNGSIVIDDDGSTMYSTGQGHGDRFFLTDIDPGREGLEVWYCQEDNSYYDLPVALRDASTGTLVWGAGDGSWGDVGRGMVADIHPGHPGMEVWAHQGPLFSAKGLEIAPLNPQYAGTFVCDFAAWWDDDLQRELTQFGRLLKYNYKNNVVDRIGTTTRPTYTVADVLGDWREEIICFEEGQVKVFTPSTKSSRRFNTFMHDPLYRLDVSFMTMGYAQACNLSFYFGEGMQEQPDYDVFTAYGADTAFVALPARFDFGSREGSPVKEGFQEILVLVGNGWLYSGELEDHKGDTADALLVDQITGMEPGIFQVPVSSGEYKVIVHAGDQQESGYTRVMAEDKPYLDLITSAGKFKVDSFIIQVDDGVLDLVFAGSPWRISGIEIKNNWPVSAKKISVEPAPRIYIDQNMKILHVESSGSIDRLSIWNVKGQLLYTSGSQGTRKVDISGFEQGIYIVHCQNQEKVFTKKVLLSPALLP